MINCIQLIGCASQALHILPKAAIRFRIFDCQLPTANCELPTANLVYRDFRAGDVRHSLADISKAQNLLGYQPSHRIDEGLKEALVWYVGNLVRT